MHSHPIEEKPIVAFVPVIDHSNNDLTWSLSQELTREVCGSLLQRDIFYLLSPDKVQIMVKKLNESHDPFGTDLAWVKKAFPNTEFVVFSEVVKHAETPLYPDKPQDSPAELTMMVCIRVFDLRGQEPKIVLQELIQNTQNIPRQFTKANFFQISWGNEMFDISPLGMAHRDLIKEISSRIEDYILINEHNR